MKDGRTHLAHKAEHAVDLETGAIVGVTVQDADDGDTETSIETLIKAAEQIEIVRPAGDGLQEVVGDKGYHSNQSLVARPFLGHVPCSCKVRESLSHPELLPSGTTCEDPRLPRAPSRTQRWATSTWYVSRALSLKTQYRIFGRGSIGSLHRRGRLLVAMEYPCRLQEPDLPLALDVRTESHSCCWECSASTSRPARPSAGSAGAGGDQSPL